MIPQLAGKHCCTPKMNLINDPIPDTQSTYLLKSNSIGIKIKIKYWSRMYAIVSHYIIKSVSDETRNKPFCVKWDRPFAYMCKQHQIKMAIEAYEYQISGQIQLRIYKWIYVQTESYWFGCNYMHLSAAADMLLTFHVLHSNRLTRLMAMGLLQT